MHTPYRNLLLQLRNFLPIRISTQFVTYNDSPDIQTSNQIEPFYLQYSSHTDGHNSRYVDTTAILRTPSLGLLSRQGYLLSSLLRAKSNPKLDNHSSESNCLVHFSDAIPRTNSRCDWKSSLGRAFVRMSACCIRKTWCFSDVDRTRRRLVG